MLSLQQNLPSFLFLETYWKKRTLNPLEEIKGDATIDVHVEAFVYGEGQICWATPAELAYMIKRLEMDSNFLVSRCNNIGNHEFEIEWSEDELFGFGFE